MKEKRVDVLLSVASFLHLVFLGFAGSLVAELFNDHQNEAILFWRSLFALVFAFSLVYIYSEVFMLTKS